MQQTPQVDRGQILTIGGISARDVQVIHGDIHVLPVRAFDARDSEYTGLVAIGIRRVGSMGEGKVIENQAYAGAIDLGHLGLTKSHHLSLEGQRPQER